MNHGEIFDFSVQTSKYQNATEAEIEMSKAEMEKQIVKNTTFANKIANAVSDFAKKSIKKAKKDF